MKKVFLALAIVMVITVLSCRKVEATETTTVDSVQVDTTKIDSTKDSCAVLDPSELEIECTCSSEQ
jgi:hypothetical protein